MGHRFVRTAGITAGALFIAIGLAAQFGGGDLLGNPQFSHPVSEAPSPPAPQPSSSPSPSPPAAPSASPSPIDLAVTAEGTIFHSFGNGGGGEHKKKKG